MERHREAERETHIDKGRGEEGGDRRDMKPAIKQILKLNFLCKEPITV